MKGLGIIDVSDPRDPELQRFVPIPDGRAYGVHVSGGLALVAAPFWFDAPTRTTLAVVVGAFYAFGAIGNFWATRGRHFGWIPLAVAVGLIWYEA